LLVPESSADTQMFRGDYSAFKAMKAGKDADVSDAEYLAARLIREVGARAACRCCHACCARQTQHPIDDDIEQGQVIPHPMNRKKATAGIDISDGNCKCLEKEALMAMATGKKGSVVCVLQGKSIGRRLRV
jgi:hypothetical protein